VQDKLRIGTRGSKLALAQAHEVKQRLLKAHSHLQDVDIEIVVMSTRGDRILDRPLAEIGGKGLFTEEIEAALMDGSIDLAVHSTKDMPTTLPDGLELCCYLERQDVRDAFISSKAKNLMDLPAGSVVGTASLRRQALTLALRPDVKVVTFRGNVQSRLKKLEENIVDATYLAMAGLNRLALDDDRINGLSEDEFLPAVAQGAICIEISIANQVVREILEPLNHPETAQAVIAERAMLAELDGSCRTPIAGLAKIDGDELTLKGQILSPDGQEIFEKTDRGPKEQAADIGTKLGKELRQMAGEEFFKRLAELAG